MGESKRDKKGHGAVAGHHDGSAGKTGLPGPPEPGGRGRSSDAGGRRKTWMGTHGRDLRFLVLFALLMGAYYLSSTTSFAQDEVFPSYLRLNARMAGAILRAVGYDITVTGQTIAEPRYSVLIGRGCDAVTPSALFVSAVLASPVRFGSRLPAAICGTVILMLINLVRIVTLLLTGIYTPKLFDVMHLDVWQAVFIFLAILLWALWASRLARRRRGDAGHAVS